MADHVYGKRQPSVCHVPFQKWNIKEIWHYLFSKQQVDVCRKCDDDDDDDDDDDPSQAVRDRLEDLNPAPPGYNSSAS